VAAGGGTPVVHHYSPVVQIPRAKQKFPLVWTLPQFMGKRENMQARINAEKQNLITNHANKAYRTSLFVIMLGKLPCLTRTIRTFASAVLILPEFSGFLGGIREKRDMVKVLKVVRVFEPQVRFVAFVVIKIPMRLSCIQAAAC
jgi:hypothetical protein